MQIVRIDKKKRINRSGNYFKQLFLKSVIFTLIKVQKKAKILCLYCATVYTKNSN